MSKQFRARPFRHGGTNALLFKYLSTDKKKTLLLFIALLAYNLCHMVSFWRPFLARRSDFFLVPLKKMLSLGLLVFGIAWTASLDAAIVEGDEEGENEEVRSLFGCEVAELLREVDEDFLKGMMRWRQCSLLRKDFDALIHAESFLVIERAIVKEISKAAPFAAQKVVEMFVEETARLGEIFGEESSEFLRSNAALASVLSVLKHNELAATAFEKNVNILKIVAPSSIAYRESLCSSGSCEDWRQRQTIDERLFGFTRARECVPSIQSNTCLSCCDMARP